jgi:hypothetical protein
MRCFRELTLALFACGLMSAPIDEGAQTLLNDSGIQQFCAIRYSGITDVWRDLHQLWR